jgi:hypothetical protein
LYKEICTKRNSVKGASKLEELQMGRCLYCGGGGVVSYWSECLNFEDRRFCPRCEAGGALAEKLAQTVARVSAEERGGKIAAAPALKAFP